MKRLQVILLAFLFIISALTLTACKKEESLDLSVYCNSTVSYKVYKDNNTNTMSLTDITSTSCPQKNYSVVQLSTNRTWSYGLTLNKVKFDIILSEPASMDIDLTISNLENGEQYNSTADTFFYHKTLTIGKEETTVELEINDTFINKDAVFSFEVVESCYTSFPNLKFSIVNFKLYGEHKPTNY